MTDIHGAIFKRVTNHDYLGVAISSDLNWLGHVRKIYDKASRTLGLLKRTLFPCSQNVKSIAYKMLVRPQLEYASEVWNLYASEVWNLYASEVWNLYASEVWNLYNMLVKSGIRIIC